MTDRAPGEALALVPFTSREKAEDGAARLRLADPEAGVVVTDGEVGTYVNPRSGEVGYLVILRGSWVVDHVASGEIVLRCKTDASDASRG